MANVFAKNFRDTDSKVLKFSKVPSVHSYLTSDALIDNYYPHGVAIAKLQQAKKTTGIKICNYLSKSIEEKASVDVSLKNLTKLLKQDFLNLQQQLQLTKLMFFLSMAF